MAQRGPGVLSRAFDAPHVGSRHMLMCRPSASRSRGGAARGGPRQLDRRDGPSDTCKIRRVGDLLVSQEFGPRSIRRLREIVHGSLPETVPPSGRLSQRLPEKRKSGIRVAKDDHVAAPTPARDAASWRTFSMSGEAGSHSVPRTCRGERPSSCVRSRSNQRRAPKSLYAPARSDRTNASQWMRVASSSGHFREPAT